MTPDAQLDLFQAVGSSPSNETSAVRDDHVAHLAARLPKHVRLGTSSWTFPGWRGIVYDGDTRLPALTRHGLKAYAEHPLFRTVGIDRSYYAPIPQPELDAYAAALPPGFETLSKVWDDVTTYVFPDHPRYGARARTKNPRFLDASVVTGEILPAYEGAFRPHTGPFVFEMPRVLGLTEGEHAEILRALERLLQALPKTFAYAFELRTPSLLNARYLEILRAHGAAHVLNFWTGMPDLRTQLGAPQVLTAPFVVARIMLPPGLKYEAGKAAFAPFNRLVAPQAGMRADVVALSRRCADEGRTLSVLVGNKAEGSAPLTVRALAEAIAQDFDGSRVPRVLR